jgi:hypothetical protein
VSYLTTIARFSGDNLGSLLKIQIARAADVAGMQDAIDGTVYGDILFNTGTGFVEWFLTTDTPRLLSEGQQSQEGEFKINRVEFALPKDRTDIKQLLNRMVNDEFVLLIEDANGNIKLFGQPWAPVRFRYTHDSGASGTEGNHYRCEFFYEGADNVYFYDGAIPAPPAGSPPVVIRWNDGESVQTIAQVLPGEVVTINSPFDYDDFNITEDIT